VTAAVATLERAIEIACEAHAAQVDKAGAPLLHPLRMMRAASSPEARMTAVVHDVLESGTAVT
jgi:(p)ppGpp synthase/HD superfamily hydrolase